MPSSSLSLHSFTWVEIFVRDIRIWVSSRINLLSSKHKYLFCFGNDLSTLLTWMSECFVCRLKVKIKSATKTWYLELNKASKYQYIGLDKQYLFFLSWLYNLSFLWILVFFYSLVKDLNLILCSCFIWIKFYYINVWPMTYYRIWRKWKFFLNQ